MPNVVSLRPEKLMGREEFEAAFLVRTRTLRESAGFTQREMADMLECGQEAYRKYESRTPLPVHLLGKFVLIVKTDLHYMVFGHRKPAVARAAVRGQVASLRPVAR